MDGEQYYADLFSLASSLQQSYDFEEGFSIDVADAMLKCRDGDPTELRELIDRLS